jgi:hypothetical protein
MQHISLVSFKSQPNRAAALRQAAHGREQGNGGTHLGWGNNSQQTIRAARRETWRLFFFKGNARPKPPRSPHALPLGL